MKFIIISASHRENSQSRKTADYLQKELANKGHECSIIDLMQTKLPLWDESVWDKDPKWEKIWGPLGKQLASCDGIIPISPEYHGMAPAALKNFFLFASKDEIGHKPGLIVTVSSGMGGAYPVAELRSSSYKNSRVCYIPEHIIIRNAEHMLNAIPDSEFREMDEFIRKRISYALDLLAAYATALATVRQSGVIDHQSHPNGL